MLSHWAVTKLRWILTGVKHYIKFRYTYGMWDKLAQDRQPKIPKILGHTKRISNLNYNKKNED